MDGRYIFRNCVPDGAIDIANVTPGDIINRAWSFRVNLPPELQSQLDSGVFDPRNILRGHDGELLDGDGNFLAEVNTWQAQINFTNTDYQAAGQKITWAIPQSYTVTLTFTETVVKDARLLAKAIAGIQARQPDAIFNFQGVLRGH
ncbi:endoglucanase [Paenibacillus alkalitolerans]|uniref:endoglucanase n=1 Tax=Paenibacillus alkalitolerans TaxID=2799335 RepID=UPI0018F740F1|nr:endoglucanase [Paenibacillus alkalitolerans]